MVVFFSSLAPSIGRSKGSLNCALVNGLWKVQEGKQKGWVAPREKTQGKSPSLPEFNPLTFPSRSASGIELRLAVTAWKHIACGDGWNSETFIFPFLWNVALYLTRNVCNKPQEHSQSSRLPPIGITYVRISHCSFSTYYKIPLIPTTTLQIVYCSITSRSCYVMKTHPSL